MIVVILAIVIGLLRVAGVKTLLCQALAHCFVGGLFGAYFAGKNKQYLILALSLTVLETVVFLATRHS